VRPTSGWPGVPRPAAPRAEREARAHGAHKLPKLEDVEDLREISPGHRRYVRRAGRRYRDVEKTIRERISKEQQSS
jgi:hypothetical protein